MFPKVGQLEWAPYEKAKKRLRCVQMVRPSPRPDEHDHSAGPSLPVGTTTLHPRMLLHLFLGSPSFLPGFTCLLKGPDFLSTLATSRFAFGEVLPLSITNLSDFPQYQNEIPSGASHFVKGSQILTLNYIIYFFCLFFLEHGLYGWP